MDENKSLAPTYNLDEGSEYFTFMLKGHSYRFRYPTLEEAEQFRSIQGDEEKSRSTLFQFITPVDPNTPPIDDIYKKMNIKESQRFINMVEKEFNNA